MAGASAFYILFSSMKKESIYSLSYFCGGLLLIGCAIRARLVFIEYCVSTPIFDRVHGELMHWRRRDAQRANARCTGWLTRSESEDSGDAREVVLTNMRNTNSRGVSPEQVNIELSAAGHTGPETERPQAQAQGEMKIMLSNRDNRQLKKPLLNDQDVPSDTS